MTMFRRIPLAAAIALIAAPAWSQFSFQEQASAQKDPGRYTIDEKTIRIESLGLAPTPAPSEVQPPDSGEAGKIIPVLDQIVNIGAKIWKIIVENKPVVDVKNHYATALPKGASGWADVSGWHPPVGAIYRLTAKNSYGATMIDVRYQVLRTYGGSYQGKGLYLTAVTVEPLLVQVGWGYHFAMEAAVPDTSIVNVGTSQDPVAGMMATLTWRISTPIKDSQGQGLYFLQGDGAFKEIDGPFLNGALEKAKSKTASAASAPTRFD